MDMFLQGSRKPGEGCGKPSALVSWRFIVLPPLMALSAPAVHGDSSPSSSDLTQLSIEELMNVEIFSAAKKTQKLFDPPRRRS